MIEPEEQLQDISVFSNFNRLHQANNEIKEKSNTENKSNHSSRTTINSTDENTAINTNSIDLNKSLPNKYSLKQKSKKIKNIEINNDHLTNQQHHLPKEIHNQVHKFKFYNWEINVDTLVRIFIIA